jgi:hypothetical protein
MSRVAVFEQEGSDEEAERFGAHATRLVVQPS